MLTFEDHTMQDFEVFYTLVEMGQYFGPRNSKDHEPSHIPYIYVHILIMCISCNTLDYSYQLRV